jgi:DNA-binding IclR family transcriptional regulator
MDCSAMSKQTDTVLAVDRALIILKYLAASQKSIGTHDLSRKFGYSSLVLDKILNSLVFHGFVEEDIESGGYKLGMSLMKIGLAAHRSLDLIQLAHPILEELTRQTRETTLLAVQQGTYAVYVDKVTSPLPVRMDVDMGARRPLNCTAVGKIFLSYSSPGTVNKLAEMGVFQRLTQRSIIGVDLLEEELAKIRDLGAAYDYQEYSNDTVCVAAPIFNYDGKLSGAITSSGPFPRMLEQLERYGELVTNAANRISNQLGYRGYFEQY